MRARVVRLRQRELVAGVSGSITVELGDAQRSAVMPAIVVMVTLAAIDLAGTGLARIWSVHQSRLALAGGIALFGVLFVVYAHGLRYAELTTVTIGWIVLLQIGVVVMELAHGAALAPPKLLAIGAILALQVYLITG